MKGTRLLSLLLMITALAAAACTTKFKDVDTEEEEDVADDDGNADADVRDDGDARDDGGPGDDGDPVDMDGDGERQCDSGPCCETSLGVFMETSFVCDSRTEHSCGADGCGADATATVIEHHCSGTSPDCDGEWITLPGTTTPCSIDQVCDTDSTTYAVCVTCDDGCTSGSCNNPDCDGGPCCNTTTGTFRPADFQCDPAIVETQTQCIGDCDGEAQQRDSHRHCTGSSAECSLGNVVFETWRTVDNCNASEICRMSASGAECFDCPYGCDSTAGDCFPQCSPADPCCDGTGRFRSNTYQCSAIPDHTEYACLGSNCGALLNVVDYMPFCTGDRADCGTSNLQEAAHTEDCGSNGRCDPSATTHCVTCPYVCYDTTDGLGVCYDDPYERNNTTDEAMGKTHFLVGSSHTGARLDHILDPVDTYAVDLDEYGGNEAWLVTATVTIVSATAPGIKRLDMAFTTPSGRWIDGITHAGLTDGSDYSVSTILSGGDPFDTFLLRLESQSMDMLVQYNFSFSRTPTTIPCGDYQDPFEPNNVVGAGAPISFDTHYPGLTLCESYDTHDYYQFTVSGTTTVTAHIDFNVVSEDGAGIEFYLRDGMDNSLNSVGDYVSTGRSLDLTYTFNPGTYYVLLTKWSTGDIYYNYDLIITSP